MGRLLLFVAGGLAALVLVLMLFAAGGPSTGSFGSGTPDPSRDRGEHVKTYVHGKYSVEVRKYLIGTHIDSSGNYVPVFFSELHGMPTVSVRDDCWLSSANDEHQQAMNGWAVSGGSVRLCGKPVPVRFPE
jgi:hypothetical protein